MKKEYNIDNMSMVISEASSEEYNTTYYTYMVQIGAETYLAPIDRTLEEIEYDVHRNQSLELELKGVPFNPTIYWVRVDMSDEIKIILLDKEATIEAIQNASIKKLRSAEDLSVPMHAAIEERRRKNMNPLLAWFEEQDKEKEELRIIPGKLGI